MKNGMKALDSDMHVRSRALCNYTFKIFDIGSY
jgi:hypothetical protein